MVSQILFVLVCILTTPGPYHRFSPTESDRQLLQGTWIPITVALNGKIYSMDQFHREVTDDRLIRLTFSGNDCSVQIREFDATIRSDLAQFHLVANQNPKQIDFLREDQTERAIYSLNSEQLRLCIRLGVGPRPTQFVTKEDSNLEIWTFKRAKPNHSSPE
jgi:uncharacterized protein (TIGR03067 family)